MQPRTGSLERSRQLPAGRLLHSAYFAPEQSATELTNKGCLGWGVGGNRGFSRGEGLLTAGVCSQVLLCNPICMVGYTLASWRFFRERIEEEEITLIHFFGEEYLEYKRKVPSGLPFIKGVKVEL